MIDAAEESEHLIDLLCGIKEQSKKVREQRFPQVVALQGILTAPLEVLMRDSDPNDPANKLHRRCQSRFKSVLRVNPKAAVTAQCTNTMTLLTCDIGLKQHMHQTNLDR